MSLVNGIRSLVNDTTPAFTTAYPAAGVPGAPTSPHSMKTPGVAASLSFLVPGLGQVYSGKVARGAGIFIGAWVLLFLYIFITAIPWFLYWLWNIYDAYKQATLHNARFPSAPVIQPSVVQPPQQPIQYQSQPQYSQYQPAQTYQPTQVREIYRETVREIVKVPCKNCGALFEQASLFCPNCGAPRK